MQCDCFTDIDHSLPEDCTEKNTNRGSHCGFLGDGCVEKMTMDTKLKPSCITLQTITTIKIFCNVWSSVSAIKLRKVQMRAQNIQTATKVHSNLGPRSNKSV